MLFFRDFTIWIHLGNITFWNFMSHIWKLCVTFVAIWPLLLHIWVSMIVITGRYAILFFLKLPLRVSVATLQATLYCHYFRSVQWFGHVQLFVTPWIAAPQASLSITNSGSSLRLMSIELVMPSSHLILGRPLLLLPPIPPSIRVFSNESTLCMRWPKYWSFSFSVTPSNEHPVG